MMTHFRYTVPRTGSTWLSVTALSLMFLLAGCGGGSGSSSSGTTDTSSRQATTAATTATSIDTNTTTASTTNTTDCTTGNTQDKDAKHGFPGTVANLVAGTSFDLEKPPHPDNDDATTATTAPALLHVLLTNTTKIVAPDGTTATLANGVRTSVHGTLDKATSTVTAIEIIVLPADATGGTGEGEKGEGDGKGDDKGKGDRTLLGKVSSISATDGTFVVAALPKPPRPDKGNPGFDKGNPPTPPDFTVTTTSTTTIVTVPAPPAPTLGTKPDGPPPVKTTATFADIKAGSVVAVTGTVDSTAHTVAATEVVIQK